MSFLYPESLYYLLPPLFILFGLLLTQKETQAHFFSDEVMSKLRVSANRLTIKARNALFLLIGFFMVLALAQPVIKDAKVKVKAKSADIMIALDISDSMLATDIYPNRLESAKQKALTLLDDAPNERIGIIAFAKNSYLVSPLSFDTDAVSFLLRQLDTRSITERGTDFLSLLNVVIESQKHKEKKYLLILSDGGDKSDFSDEIELAKDNGVVVFILAVASKKGAPIKKDNGEFIKYKGDIIISKLNENIAKFATSTGGVYIQSTTSSDDIKTMFNEISKISDEKELKSEEVTKFIPLFYYPLGMAIFLLLIATSSLSRKTSLSSFIVLVLLSLSNPLHVEADMLDFIELNKAKKAYEENRFEESAKLYEEHATQTSNGQSYYNAANSYYKQKKYKKALEAYQKATFDTKEQRAQNSSNIGNAYAKSGNFKKAVEAYEKSLKMNEDKNTRENLETVKKLIKEQEKNKKDDKKKESDKQDKKNKDKKDGKKKESDENKDKSSDEKDESKDKKDSSKSKDSKDKKQDKDDMKSKNEKEEQTKKDKEEKSKERKDKLDKLEDKEKSDDEKDAEANAAKEMKDKGMSEAEEQKWLKQLNSKSNTYLYKLNDNKQQRNDEDEKPW